MSKIRPATLKGGGVISNSSDMAFAVVFIHAYIEKKTGPKKTQAAGWSESSQRVFQKNGGRSGAAIINPTACSVFFKGQSRFRKFLFPDLVPKQSRKDPLNDFLKQSGARSAPGIFCSIWAPEAAKT